MSHISKLISAKAQRYLNVYFLNLFLHTLTHIVCELEGARIPCIKTGGHFIFERNYDALFLYNKIEMPYRINAPL